MKSTFGLALVLALLASVATLTTTAHARGPGDDIYTALEQYFNYQTEKDELIAALHNEGWPPPTRLLSGDSYGAEQSLAPAAPRTTASTASDTEDDAVKRLGLHCANGGTPVILSGSVPDPGTYDISITGDPTAQTMTFTFNNADLAAIVVDVSAC